MEERDSYTIGETALITGISTKALRYYDSLHLVVPERRDPHNNYRYYSREQIISLIIVQRLRMMGCSLKALRTVLEGNDLSSLHQAMEHRIAELRQEIADRLAIINDNTDFITQLEVAMRFQNGARDTSSVCGLLSNARVEEVPISYIFSEERVMPHYNVMDTSVNFRVELYARCKASGLQILGPEITTYYTDLLGQFVARDCKIRIGIVVEENSTCSEIQTFGGFTAATAIHMGNYDSMVNTHMMLLRWINQNGYVVTGHVSEEFLISPISLLSQQDQIIKIIIPVAKAT